MKTIKFFIQLVVVGAIALLLASCSKEEMPTADENVCVYSIDDKMRLSNDDACLRYAFVCTLSDGRTEWFWVTYQDYRDMPWDFPVYNECFDYIVSGRNADPCNL